MSKEINPNASIIAVWISLISNIILTILKIVVGTLFNSPVLLADGFHNAGDVVASGAALTSMHISKRPADEDHPYGHGKAEVISSGIVALILGGAAIYIAYEAVSALFESPAKASFLALLTAIVSLVWKQALYVYTIRLGKLTNSKGLIATAYDHLADVYASLAAVLGIGLALIGDIYHDSTPLLRGSNRRNYCIRFGFQACLSNWNRSARYTYGEKCQPGTPKCLFLFN